MNKIFIKEKKEEEKLVGVYIPTKEANRLALYSILNGKTRTGVLRSLLDKYFSEIPKIDEIVKRLGNQVYLEWVELLAQKIESIDWKKTTQVRSMWFKYRKKIKRTLEAKRLPNELVLQILDEAERLRKENDV